MADSDCVVVMGSNMAENHPVAFRWPMQAKVEHGAKLIHVDPRFTRTSAVSDIYAPVRAGSDIAFLGGIIRHVIESERWNKDPFFRSWVVNYTNAATIISADYKDAEDNDGVFSGLMGYKGGVTGVAVQRIRRSVRRQELAVRPYPRRRSRPRRRNRAVRRSADRFRPEQGRNPLRRRGVLRMTDWSSRC